MSVAPASSTCLWQVRGRNKITDFKDWVVLEPRVHFIRWSLWLDLKILLRTVPVVLFRLIGLDGDAQAGLGQFTQGWDKLFLLRRGVHPFRRQRVTIPRQGR